MTSTINPNIPVDGTDIDAPEIQQNFQAAANDINGIETTLAGLGNMSTQSQNNVTITGGTIAANGAGITHLTAANIDAGTAGIDISGNAATVATINGKIAPGTNITITGSGTSSSPYTISSSGGAGSVTSVGVATDGFFLTESGSPITSAGTITLSDATHPAFTLIGNPTGSIATPTDVELAGTLVFSGDELHTAALTGDVTTAPNSFVTSIGTGAVVTAKIADHAVTGVKMAIGPITSLTGYDGSGIFSDVAVGSGLTLSGGILTNTGPGSGTVTSVTGLNTDNTNPATPIVKISVDGVTITGAGTPASPLVGTGIQWTEVTTATQALMVKNGYIMNNASQVVGTLPSSATIGSEIRIAGKGAGGWKIAQNAGQTIHFGTQNTTTGVGGFIASQNVFDCLDLLCITADTDWLAHSSQGNLTVT